MCCVSFVTTALSINGFVGLCFRKVNSHLTVPHGGEGWMGLKVKVKCLQSFHAVLCFSGKGAGTSSHSFILVTSTSLWDSDFSLENSCEKYMDCCLKHWVVKISWL